MRPMSRAALAALAKYKVDAARSQLDKMWDRRVLPPKSVRPRGAAGSRALHRQFGI